MPLVRLVLWLLSLPLVWAGHAASMLRLGACVPLFGAAWRVGGDAPTGVLALTRTAQLASSGAARARAQEWFALRPQPEIAAYAGLLAVDASDLAAAKDFLARAQSAGMDRLGLTELLELHAAAHSDDETVMSEVVTRLAGRTDLAPAASKMVRESLLLEALNAGRNDDAEERARHLLSIEDNPLAAVALWIVERRRGSTAPVSAALAPFNLPEALRLFFEANALAMAGMLDEARRLLPALRQANAEAAEKAAAAIARKEAAP